MPRGGKRVGAGRKTTIAEQMEADFLWKVFTTKYTEEELRKVLKKKHSIKDAWMAKAFAGNERFISQIVHKLLPDNIKHEGGINLAALLDEVDLVDK